MAFDSQTKIGDIVLDLPATMRVFEALNVDYCCGGHRSLAEACAHAGAPLAEVLARLQGPLDPDPAPDPKAWQSAPLADLIAHIEATHHAFTRSELARVAPLMAKVLEVHGAHHPELARIAQCFAAMERDLKPHLEKEEQVLFPYVRALEAGRRDAGCCFGTVANPIRAMQNEHEEVGDLLRELRTLTRDYRAPEDACASFRSLYMGLQNLEEDLHLHIYLESHLLFPRAIALEAAVLQS